MPQNILRSLIIQKYIYAIFSFFTGAGYVDILEEVLLLSLKAVLDEEPIYFVEDNCPIHKSQIVSKWFEDHPKIIQIRWPPRRPDLNILEHVWAIMTQEWDHQNERTAQHL